MDYAAARRAMVENQLRTNRITDPRVVDAIRQLPREQFLPDPLKGIAYVDEDIHIGSGRYLLEPLALARLLEAAAVNTSDVVLDIGCNCGFGAAVLAMMADTVVALESDDQLAERASRVLEELAIHNAAVVQGPLALGYERGGPYDAIIFEGAISDLPQTIVEQLAEGGRAVAVISIRPGLGRGTVFTRTHGTLSQRTLFEAASPLLPGFEPKEKFAFI